MVRSTENCPNVRGCVSFDLVSLLTIEHTIPDLSSVFFRLIITRWADWVFEFFDSLD